MFSDEASVSTISTAGVDELAVNDDGVATPTDSGGSLTRGNSEDDCSVASPEASICVAGALSARTKSGSDEGDVDGG